MNRKITLLTLFTLLAGTSVISPDTAFAERDDNVSNDRREQRVEKQRPQRAERNTPQHVERERPQYRERKNSQRTERFERREQKPAVSQHRADQKRYSTVAPRHVESRRTYRVERPRHIVRHRYYHPVPRNRYFRGIRIYRPYGYLYPGFGYYYSDHDAFRFLAFTAVTLAIIQHLDEPQQRMHEHALVLATTAEIGDTHYWGSEHSSGSVTLLYIGSDARGREYREFRQEVTTGGRTETSYARAYLNSNGRWDVTKIS